ncbi:MAG: hypothetical protein QXS54_12915 [Candidatus Methanomethylicaceae archaeon]
MIHHAIMTKIAEQLTQKLITEVPTSDPARVGVVVFGPLQGNPDPDEARISVTIHDGDPDNFSTGTLTSMKTLFVDEVIETEIGGSVIWKRVFTVKCRVLLERTKEDLEQARQIVATLKQRVETALLTINMEGISYDNEKVIMSIIPDSLASEIYQAGGPPNEYDFFMKFRFAVMTYQRS